MAYFYNFPVIPYDNFGEGNFQLMTNILTYWIDQS